MEQSKDDLKEIGFDIQIKELREIINEFSKENSKLSGLLHTVVDELEKDKDKYMGQDISIIINQMRHTAINQEIKEFAKKWYVDVEDVRYEVYSFRDGILANENNLKEKADYTAYKKNTSDPMPKFKFRKEMIVDFKNDLMEKISPLLG